MRGTYRFANMVVRVESLYSNVHRRCAAYRTDEAPMFVVRTTGEDIEYERARTDFACSNAYLEESAVYRKIAERSPSFGTVLMHGSGIAVDGRAYVL